MLDFIPTRIAVAILSFFGFQCLYMTRFNLSVISVAMISNKHHCNSSLIENTTDCLTSNEEQTTVDWDQQSRGLVLGAFFYGYALTQIVGGRLSETLGPKLVFGTAVAVPGLLTLLFPLASKHSFLTAMGLRILQGLFQGMSFPSMHTLISRWIPPNERSRYVGIIYLGSTLSIVLTLPLCALIVQLLSWEGAFYITGLIPLVWGAFWYLFFYDHPSQHPRISKTEQELIEKSTFASGTVESCGKRTVPWKRIATNLPFVSSVFCDVGNSYGLSFLATQLPNYMLSVFHFSVLESGFYSSLPFLFRYLGGVFFSCIIDKLISSSKITVTNARRYFSMIATFLPGIIIIIIPTLQTVNQTVILLCLSNFFNGAIAGSQLVNATDLAPTYAGTLFGISNTFASMAGFISPAITGVILQSSESKDQWKIAFWICAPLYIVLEIFYVVFVSGEVQSFNFHQDKKDTELETDKENSEVQ